MTTNNIQIIDAKSYHYKSWLTYNYISLKDLPLNDKWKEKIFNEIFKMKKIKILNNFLNNEKKLYEIFPYPELIYNAFNYTNYDNIKVIIIGQDPYANFELYNDTIIPNAMGLSFSVPYNNSIPSSLKNIYKNLKKFNHLIDNDIPQHGNLYSWTIQGCLMINSSLTVTQGKPNSHSIYWNKITDKIIKHLSDEKNNLIFVLWGLPALSKKKLINEIKHKILISSHPSGLSCNNKLKEYPSFMSFDVFGEINKYLKEINNQPILWQL